MATQFLHLLLDRAQRYGPTYSSGLSNHLPMALVALHALGASDARLEDYFQQTCTKLETEIERTDRVSVDFSAAPGGWISKRGDAMAHIALRAHFSQLIRTVGFDEALRAVLPMLLDGVGAAAFHGLLRVAAATVSRHHGELANGLAHWACAYLPLARHGAAGQHPAAEMAVGRWLAEIAARATGFRGDGQLIADRMIEFGRTDALQSSVSLLQVTPTTLAELSRIAVDLYLRTTNFTVLHLVTSAHAVRMLAPWVDDLAFAVRHYAYAFAAGVAAAEIDSNQPLPPIRALTWERTIARACGSNSDHVVKLVYACRDEFAATGDDRYRSAASLATQALPG